ncbi:MAG: hypothetical protein EOP45_10660 [Sphingobacteriaceae bacterium]|nr:MAG: hypothetical protein EOP45_10660 [Sphingobacteriaceae bacterium]
MELDNLKQAWKESYQPEKASNENILELIQHKSNGPIAALKRGFKRQILAIVFAIILIINSFQHRQIWNDMIFWCYLFFCAALCLFFYSNYRTASKMESKYGMIKKNLELQVAILEKRMKWHPIRVRAVLLFFILLVEVIANPANEPMIAKWHKIPLLLRLGMYAMVFVIQHYASRYKWQHKYGRHLSNLKQLLQQMQ